MWLMALYFVLLLFLAPRLSLWLDEILTLAGALSPDLMENLRQQQGATPLAFLVPRWVIGLGGFSNLTARLPSIIASTAACPAVYWLARRSGIKRPLLAVLVFALWPLQFRYAIEARPYAMAMCLGLWLTVTLLAEMRAVVYVLLTLAIAMTHPYALVISASHLVWSFAFDKRRMPLILTALGISLACLLPWYLHFREDWRAMSAQQQLSFTNWRAILVFLREFSGSGYIGAAILFAGIALSLRKKQPFWLVGVVVPMALIPMANIAFDYFFAIRQMIYILPACTILFMVGTESWGKPFLLCVFLVASIYSDVRWFQRPREDWAAAADAAASEPCIVFVGDSARLYTFFRPELSRSVCGPDPQRLVVAGSRYESQARAKLLTPGFTKQSEQSFNGPYIEVFVK